ncbi:oligosaccharide flippase family protein [Bombilactobacillus folatiphilus]|uniref:Oligosaccharide flippase family protein n=1 Tax=Bombilactobacillus folatiphilus TaxID=2923362 RepID=A0ABY4P7X1_9LACO|nr:oligosaccharide flippase family protein [Bombilactobacillus folatiphilus]UQS81712.1 oligosaccharide flippase family protein [Bombilactobacillus folatiphilus]
MQLIKNYLYNVCYQIFILLIPLVTMPYISRVLGTKGSGIASFTASNAQYFVLLAALGISVYGNREVAYHRNDPQQLSQIFWEIFSLRMLTTIVSLSCFYIFCAWNRAYLGPYLAQSLLIVATALDVSWFFMGLEKFKVTVLRNFLIKLLSLVLIFLFVKKETDVVIYILITTVSQLIGNLSLFTYLKPYIHKPQLPVKLQRHFQQAILFFIPQIAVSLYTSLNKTILGILVSVSAAGIFDYADRIVRLALAVVTAAGTVMLPRMAASFAKGKMDQIKRYLYLTFQAVTALSSPMMFGLAAIAVKFAPFFLGKSFGEVGILIMAEAIVIVFIAWENILGNQYLIPIGRTWTYTKAILTGAVISLLVCWPLITVYGALGAVFASILAELSVLLYELWSIHKAIQLKLLFKECWKFWLASLAMFLVVFPLNLIWPFNLAILFGEVLIGILIYGGVLFWCKPSIVQAILQQIKS